MTKLDHALLEFVGFVRAHHGIPPVGRDMNALMGRTHGTQPNYWHKRLEEAGCIDRAVGGLAARDYYVTPFGEDAAARLLAEGVTA